MVEVVVVDMFIFKIHHRQVGHSRANLTTHGYPSSQGPKSVVKLNEREDQS